MPKILVADDSIAVRKVAERLLTEAGLGVTLAANGEEALALLAKEVPDLIVSDVIMPDKSGYEVCAFVRGQAALAKTPVLLISGIVNDEVTKQAESCHADGVLKKPFQGTSLKDRVLELLGKKQQAAVAAPAPAKPAPAPAAPPAPAPSVAISAEPTDLSSPDAREAQTGRSGARKGTSSNGGIDATSVSTRGSSRSRQRPGGPSRAGQRPRGSGKPDQGTGSPVGTPQRAGSTGWARQRA